MGMSLSANHDLRWLAVELTRRTDAMAVDLAEARAEIERLTGAGIAAYNPETVAAIIADRDALAAQLATAIRERDEAINRRKPQRGV